MKPELLLQDFSRALSQFEGALGIPAEHDVIRAGCIQYFEFTFELAWKTIKAIAESEGLDAGGSPKSCLRAAFAQGWIDEEAPWLEMLDARNRMSHTCDAQDALGIYGRLKDFLQPLARLQSALEKRG